MDSVQICYSCDEQKSCIRIDLFILGGLTAVSIPEGLVWGQLQG
jgi:hypothetical protein